MCFMWPITRFYRSGCCQCLFSDSLLCVSVSPLRRYLFQNRVHNESINSFVVIVGNKSSRRVMFLLHHHRRRLHFLLNPIGMALQFFKMKISRLAWSFFCSVCTFMFCLVTFLLLSQDAMHVHIAYAHRHTPSSAFDVHRYACLCSFPVLVCE